MQERADSRSGQSLVEMALILPFILLLIFGIIDIGWYVFGYATVYQAARNGAEKAAEIPPYLSKVSPLNRGDLCVSTILSSTLEGTPEVMFRDLASGQNGNTFAISYPNNKRQLGQPIQIDLVYNIQPLTPFWRLITFGNQGTMQVRASTRRSIESLGDNPNAPNLIACQP
ncbi:MAG: pilus assembly protein [Kouleothrix sp.]|nr:pilus assembly protein [Kouleothrix sp.]